MKKTARILSALVLLFALAVSVVRAATASERGDCSRIVAISPSLVEVVFALGLGDQLIGVSSYSNFPDKARSLPVVGGLLDPNLEAIYSLSPSIVFALDEQRAVTERLQPLGIKTVHFEHRHLNKITASMQEIATFCEVKEQGRELLEGLQRRVAELRTRVPSAERKLPQRVLIVIGLPEDEGSIRNLFISGRDGFYNDLIELAGGVNVVKAGTLSLPQISREGLLSLNPEVIIHIASEREKQLWGDRDLSKPWSSLATIEAVRDGRVYMVSGDYAVIPGPRFTILLEDFINILWLREAS